MITALCIIAAVSLAGMIAIFGAKQGFVYTVWAGATLLFLWALGITLNLITL